MFSWVIHISVISLARQVSKFLFQHIFAELWSVIFLLGWLFGDFFLILLTAFYLSFLSYSSLDLLDYEKNLSSSYRGSCYYLFLSDITFYCGSDIGVNIFAGHSYLILVLFKLIIEIYFFQCGFSYDNFWDLFNHEKVCYFVISPNR